VLADERRAPVIGCLARAWGWFFEQGIHCRRVLSDNGSSYRSGDGRQTREALGLKPIRTKATTSQTNGKAERFIKQNTLRGVGDCRRLPDLGGAQPLAAPLFGDLQWLQMPHGSGRPHPPAMPQAPAEC
jgi:transposase InsO family protein